VDLENRHKALKEAIETAEEQFNANKVTLEKEQAKAEVAQQHADAQATRAKDAADEYVKCISEAGFTSQELYQLAKRTDAERSALEHEIKQHDALRNKAQGRLEKAAEDAKGLSQPDIETLNNLATLAAAALKELEASVNNATYTAGQTEKLVKQLEKLRTDIESERIALESA
jgi:DNA repair protein SbcC/Rad50